MKYNNDSKVLPTALTVHANRTSDQSGLWIRGEWAVEKYSPIDVRYIVICRSVMSLTIVTTVCELNCHFKVAVLLLTNTPRVGGGGGLQKRNGNAAATLKRKKRDNNINAIHTL